MVHNQIHTIDLLIIAAYLIAMVLIGLVVVRKVRNMDDYYLGGRSFGPLVLMATVCATIIGGSGLMGRAGVAYSSGFKAIMTALPYLLGMFIFSGFAGRISAVGTTFHVTSIPDLFEQRFGKTTKVILGGLIAFTMMGTVASQVTATATIINMLGNEIGLSYEMGALIACVVFIVYTATSGLFGVIYTDVFQFVMLILFVYILIPGASLLKLGGPAAFFRNLAPELATPYVDGNIIGDIITLTAAFWETSSPIWFSPWQVRKCGSAPLLQRVRRRQRRACSSAPSCTVSPSLSSGLWEWSRISLSAEIRLPCTALPMPSFRLLPLRFCRLGLRGLLLQASFRLSCPRRTAI